jgi:hypothetical protein
MTRRRAPFVWPLALAACATARAPGEDDAGTREVRTGPVAYVQGTATLAGDALAASGIDPAAAPSALTAALARFVATTIAPCRGAQSQHTPALGSVALAVPEPCDLGEAGVLRAGATVTISRSGERTAARVAFPHLEGAGFVASGHLDLATTDGRRVDVELTLETFSVDGPRRVEPGRRVVLGAHGAQIAGALLGAVGVRLPGGQPAVEGAGAGAGAGGAAGSGGAGQGSQPTSARIRDANASGS